MSRTKNKDGQFNKCCENDSLTCMSGGNKGGKHSAFAAIEFQPMKPRIRARFESFTSERAPIWPMISAAAKLPSRPAAARS